ncbi:MAG: MFS transporter [Rickettsiales bacterium]|nr:MFS transporter [Rickettsiales bacterium]
MAQKKRSNRSVAAAMIGTALEYYDMSLYGLMAPLLISIFLPGVDKLDALILTFVMTPISIIVRPIGAVVIGRIGDIYGRKRALLISIGGMAAVTGMIGALPDYQSIGYLAPISFVIFRSLQGFFLAGEYNGAAIFSLEHSDTSRQGYVSGLYSMYTVVGILFATTVATTISYLPEKYWRIPYFIGFIAGFLGLYMRKLIYETPDFIKNQKQSIPRSDLENIANYKRALVAISVSGLFGALCIMPTILMNSLLPIATSFSLSTIMLINTITTVISMLLYPVFGKLADRIGLNQSMQYSIIGILILSYPLISLLETNKLENIILMKLGFAILMAWFIGPFNAWIQQLFHTKERYSLISLFFSIGYQLGGFTAPLSLLVWKHLKSFSAIYTILMFFSLCALISLMFLRKQGRN